MSERVCVSFRRELPDDYQNQGNISNLHHLFAELRDQELQPVLSVHAESAFADDRISAFIPDAMTDRPNIATTVELSEVTVILNCMGRSFRVGLLANPEALPPIINENQTRSLAHRKIRAHSEVLQPLGLSMPTALVTDSEDIDAFLSEQSATHLIVKPDSGQNGEYVHRVMRTAIHDLFAANQGFYNPANRYVVQPAYNFTVPFPSGLRAYDMATREAFEASSQSDKPKELRIYGFHSPAGTTTFPVGRLVNGGDYWFFVDPESVPDHLLEGTAKAMNRVSTISGAAAVYGTVDFGFGSDGTNEQGWRAIELNARLPYLIGPDKHPGISKIVHSLLAEQITATSRPVRNS